MARGIERRKIFKDDKDRKSFLGRFANILEETQKARCQKSDVGCQKETMKNSHMYKREKLAG